jgi:uncharacterized membrane protein
MKGRGYVLTLVTGNVLTLVTGNVLTLVTGNVLTLVTGNVLTLVTGNVFFYIPQFLDGFQGQIDPLSRACRKLFARVKRSDLDSDLSPRTKTEFENTRKFNFTPPNIVVFVLCF